MKKRRELDALVNGKSGRRKKKGQHELLRSAETDSSDVEGYSIQDKVVVRKCSTMVRFCSTCMMVAGFFLLTACAVTIGGLVWVHMDLKKEVDHLRLRLHKVESYSQDSPNEFHSLHSNVQDINNDIKDIRTMTTAHLLNISNIIKQIGLLNATTQDLQSSLAAAPQLKTLPSEVEQVKQQLLKLGSDLETLKSNAKDIDGFKSYKDLIQEQINHIKDSLQQIESKQSRVSLEPSATSHDVISLQNNLEDMIYRVNFTLMNRFITIRQDRDIQRAQMVYLQNRTQALETRLEELESRMGNVGDNKQVRSIIADEINKLNLSARKMDPSALQGLQYHIVTINNSLTSLEPQIRKMATLESVRDLTSRLDSVSTHIVDDIQAINTTLYQTSQRVTELQRCLEEHAVRLDKLADHQSSPKLNSSYSQVQQQKKNGNEDKSSSTTARAVATVLPDMQQHQTQDVSDRGSTSTLPNPTRLLLTSSHHPVDSHGVTHSPNTADNKEEAQRDRIKTTKEEDDAMDSLISALEKEHQ